MQRKDIEIELQWICVAAGDASADDVPYIYSKLIFFNWNGHNTCTAQIRRRLIKYMMSRKIKIIYNIKWRARAREGDRERVIFITRICQSPPSKSSSQWGIRFVSCNVVVVICVCLCALERSCDGDNRCSDNLFQSRMSAIGNGTTK